MSNTTDLGFEVKKRNKGTQRGQTLYDIVSKEQYRETLVNLKEFLGKYYQELSYKQLSRNIKSMFNVIISSNEIRNIIIGMNLLPKNIDSSTRKFTKKEFPTRVSRGLFLEYYDYNTLEKVKLRPYG